MTTLLLAFLLSAPTFAADADGDGWDSTVDDCDDANEDVWPGGPEMADGLDNDCDSVVDEGTQVYDDDGDGYTEVQNDCDDGDPAVNEAAVELCNGIDDDCDGLLDDYDDCVDPDWDPEGMEGGDEGDDSSEGGDDEGGDDEGAEDISASAETDEPARACATGGATGTLLGLGLAAGIVGRRRRG